MNMRESEISEIREGERERSKGSIHSNMLTKRLKISDKWRSIAFCVEMNGTEGE